MEVLCYVYRTVNALLSTRSVHKGKDIVCGCVCAYVCVFVCCGVRSSRKITLVYVRVCVCTVRPHRRCATTSLQSRAVCVSCVYACLCMRVCARVSECMSVVWLCVCAPASGPSPGTRPRPITGFDYCLKRVFGN